MLFDIPIRMLMRNKDYDITMMYIFVSLHIMIWRELPKIRCYSSPLHIDTLIYLDLNAKQCIVYAKMFWIAWRFCWSAICCYFLFLIGYSDFSNEKKNCRMPIIEQYIHENISLSYFYKDCESRRPQTIPSGIGVYKTARRPSPPI